MGLDPADALRNLRNSLFRLLFWLLVIAGVIAVLLFAGYSMHK